MPAPYPDRLRADRRLYLLQILAEQRGDMLSSSNLTVWLQQLRVPALRPDVLDDLRFLRDAGLVSLESLADIHGLYGARITRLGHDVVDGRERAAGVSQPEDK